MYRETEESQQAPRIPLYILRKVREYSDRIPNEEIRQRILNVFIEINNEHGIEYRITGRVVERKLGKLIKNNHSLTRHLEHIHRELQKILNIYQRKYWADRQ